MIYHDFTNSYLVNHYVDENDLINFEIAYSSNSGYGRFKQRHFVFKSLPTNRIECIDDFIHMLKVYIEDPSKLNLRLYKAFSEAMCKRAIFNLTPER